LVDLTWYTIWNLQRRAPHILPHSLHSKSTIKFCCSTFIGPNGKFSIEHPSDWLERQVVRPPVLLAIAFTSPNDLRTNITVLYIPNTTLFNNPDIATLLSTDVNYLQRHNNTTISKPIDCNAYKVVADNRACIATIEMVGFDRTQFRRMALGTSIDGGIYVLQFKDTKADFNQTLPVFLQMLLTSQPK
jgi:hypothetical protein